MIGYVSRQGTSSGPCPVDCRHDACRIQRHEAGRACSICRDRMGYDTSFRRGEDKGVYTEFTHVRCLESRKDDLEKDIKAAYAGDESRFK